MRSALSHLLSLRKLMLGMEAELGIAQLSQVEIDILCAASECANEDRVFDAADVMEHPILAGVSKSSYHRAFNKLKDEKYFVADDGFVRRHYKLSALKTSGA